MTAAEAWSHLEGWYSARITAEEWNRLRILNLREFDKLGDGAYAFAARTPDSLSIVRVGPRGGVEILMSFTSNQFEELSEVWEQRRER